MGAKSISPLYAFKVAAMFNVGDAVEVNRVVMAQGYGKAPFRAWSRGYQVESIEGRTALLKVTSPGFKLGCVVRYDLRDVRLLP
jgi:hypothetical protein